MKRTILMSLLVIGAVVAVIVGATTAYFSDKDEATATFSADTINIWADGSYTWGKYYTVGPLKPSETGEIKFKVYNPGPNNVVIWKRLTVTEQRGGAHPESELVEDSGDKINNLAGWMFYDLYVDGTPIIDEAQQVRVDNVSTVWIKLGPLGVGEYMEVKQSYHLRPETTNWAQGDEMDFSMELLATQTNDPGGPIPSSGTIGLVAKDKYWIPDPASGAGTVTYSYTSSSPGNLTASFIGTVPQANTLYSMIYYPDPWPGSPGCVFGSALSLADRSINIGAGTCTPVAAAGDQNMPAGIKIWLVPSGDYDTDHMEYWNPSNYLFETNLLPLP